MQVQSLSWEDPLEQEMAMCSSVLAWESHGQRSLVATIHAESNMTEQLSTHMRAHTHAHAHTHTRTRTHTHTHTYTLWVSLVAQFIKNPPAMQETLVQFLG